MNKLKVLLLLFVVTHTFGQINVAKIDRSLWPNPINSKVDFDVASKMEMLVFAQIFNDYMSLSVSELSLKIGVKNVSEKSVAEWETKTKKLLLDNFHNLLDESLPKYIPIKKDIDWNSLITLQLNKNVPSELKNWYNSSKVFYQDYLSELYRLAALNSRITSEIATIDDNEITGDRFKQKYFLLTFDDGPTPQNGNTDKLVKVLNENNLKGIFFVLGDNFNQRLNSTSSKSIEMLYGQNLVASHGKIHKSHQRLQDWQNSIDFTQDIIKSNIKSKTLVYFRPPYGQRNKTVVEYLNNHQSKVMLWNMDSQDWNKEITGKEVADRQITLMLLWRKGILLFHDVHSKVQTAVPLINNYFRKADIKWIDPSLETI
jgi:peptidoglycan-N-acetylglucosamine deacetylase